MKKMIALLLTLVLALSMLTACSSPQKNSDQDTTQSTEETPARNGGNDESAVPELESPAEGPASVSNIASVENVPLLTLNNGVQIPQLGLGTQIQRLENDASESGRKLLNDTSHDAVVAALQSGYRHFDTAHGYNNETGVGQAIIDSGVPREEIWVTSKLWPSEYGEGTTIQAIDDMLERLQLDYLDCIYLHHPAGDYLGAWKDLEEAYKQGKVRALGISNFDNWPEAFDAIIDNSEITPQILQIECHPFAQRLETRELAGQYDIQIECWYPLGHADDRLLNNDVLSKIAEAHDKSVVQIILRWHMQEGFSAVPGSTNPDHIQENIEIFDFELFDEEMEQIRDLDQGEDGRYFNLNYEQMGGFFTNR
ncbi:MAG: aldo/keto reductase [Clostridiales bacterium]|jgi:diketogulonate reductase-like aldo/keto reductase|nr:aldo/keto reductase [Clostridiales bacterium]